MARHDLRDSIALSGKRLTLPSTGISGRSPARSEYCRRLRFEQLEERSLLSVSVALASKADWFSTSGGGPSGTYQEIAVSADGRYIAFSSEAPNLVSGAEVEAGQNHIYRFDRTTGECVLVSYNAAGTSVCNSSSFRPAISADGNVVAFVSYATDIHTLDLDDNSDIYARNMTTGVTQLVSVNASGTESANNDCDDFVLSAIGNVIAFGTKSNNIHTLDANNSFDVFARDLLMGVTHLVSVNGSSTSSGNAGSSSPVVSADGHVIAFSSVATDLIFAGINTGTRLYARNIATGSTQLVSVNTDGNGGANGFIRDWVISANGRMVAFESDATNLHPMDSGSLTDIFARDLFTGTTHLVSSETPNASFVGSAAISADGNLIAFESGGNVHVRDVVAGTTELVSVNIDGTGAANNSGSPQIRADGSIVAFMSGSKTLHLLDTDNTGDIYIRNRITGITYLASLNTLRDGSGDAHCAPPILSADGSVVAFSTASSNLVDGDGNLVEDVFTYDIATDTVQLASAAAPDSLSDSANDSSIFEDASLSANGRYVAFLSTATNLVDVST